MDSDRTRTEKDYIYLKCPCCQAELPFDRDSELAKKHLIECAIEAQLLSHPEVEQETGEGAESEEEMGKPSNK